ncbi:MAG: Gfo/Idh/MocA family oxidoreductase [Chloroflexi bacterium]|nr:Gfo/Idh/MocA family oxidoreductase [Chloroflexota bacterium]
MNTPLRAGLVGCGSLSQRGILPHLSLSDAQQKVRLVAVVDAVAERAQQTAERYGVAAHFTAIEEMLAQVELDLALIITPIQYHYANALAAIAAGKHVYVQKAMATTLADADALLSARDRMGVKLAAAPGFELFPTTAQMREIVAGGELGRVAVAMTYTLGFGHEFEPIRGGQSALEAINPAWYYRPGAGPLPDVTVYALQLATSVLGPVRRVTALGNRIQPRREWQGQTIDVQVDDNTLLLMEFASGALGTAVGSNSKGSPRIPWGGLGLYGTQGSLEVTEVNNASGYPLAFDVRAARSYQSRTELDAQPYLTGEHLTMQEPHVYADILDLVDAIQENRAPRASGEQARHVVEIIEKALLAAATGQTQALQSSF